MADVRITGKTRRDRAAHSSDHDRTTHTLNQVLRAGGLDEVAVSIDIAPADMPALVRGLKA